MRVSNVTREVFTFRFESMKFRQGKITDGKLFKNDSTFGRFIFIYFLYIYFYFFDKERKISGENGLTLPCAKTTNVLDHHGEYYG